jgi:hypothetical protein
VSDEKNPPAGVPLRKSEPGRPDGSTPRPRPVTYALIALLVAAVFGLLIAVSWSTQRTWVKHQLGKANASAVSSAVASATKHAAQKSQDVASASASASSSAIKNNPIGGKKLGDQTSRQISGAFIGGFIDLLICGFLAYGAYRGRHWTRWAVTGFFVLATFTGIGIGLLNLVNAILVSGIPASIRVPTVVSSLAMLVAVVMVNLRPSVEYFALSRPAPRPGMPQRRGLFGRPVAPRPSQPTRATRNASPARAEPAVTREADADRSKAKKRASAESVSRGAELARRRAKASKSRRTER